MLDDIVKGINGPQDKRFKICLIEKGTGTVVFAIPATKDQQEKEGVLEDQVFKRLIQFSNMYNSYQKAIEEVQGYLRALCKHLPLDKPWIVDASERAGKRFLIEINKAKSMQQRIKDGEMIIDIKDIIGGGKHES